MNEYDSIITPQAQAAQSTTTMSKTVFWDMLLNVPNWGLRAFIPQGRVPHFVTQGYLTQSPAFSVASSRVANSIPLYAEWLANGHGGTTQEANSWRLTTTSPQSGSIVGNIFPNASSAQGEDLQPLYEYTFRSGSRVVNYFYSYEPFSAQGWEQNMLVGYVMPIYRMSCSRSGATSIAIGVAPSSADAGNGDVRVGSGNGNPIEFVVTDGGWSITEVGFSNQQVFERETVEGYSGWLFTDDNSNSSNTNELYEYTVTGRTTGGVTISRDPQVINRPARQPS